MKIALMIIDMQKGFYTEASKVTMDAAIKTINKILPIFRNKKYPIVWVQHEEEYKSSDEGFEIISSLDMNKDEYIIVKKYGNVFNKTKCKEIFDNENINTVLITGYCAEYCVLSSYRGALDLDYTPLLLHGALASDKYENIVFVESIHQSILIESLNTIIEK